MLMSVLTATEEELVAFWGRCFTKVFPAYFTESKEKTKYKQSKMKSSEDLKSI